MTPKEKKNMSLGGRGHGIISVLIDNKYEYKKKVEVEVIPVS